MATLLSSIVVVFLCCHSTKLVTNTYEAYQMVYYGELMVWPPWAEVLSRWNHFMLAVNASINIFIYVVKVVEPEPKKRKLLLTILCFAGLQVPRCSLLHVLQKLACYGEGQIVCQ
jgi:hypothetical protein